MHPLPIPEHELPDRNGYDDFLAATKLLPANPIVSSGNFDSETAALAQMQAAGKEILPAIDRVRIGLSKPVWKQQDYTSDDRLMDDIMEFRTVGPRVRRRRESCVAGRAPF